MLRPIEIRGYSGRILLIKLDWPRPTGWASGPWGSSTSTTRPSSTMQVSGLTLILIYKCRQQDRIPLHISRHVKIVSLQSSYFYFKYRKSFSSRSTDNFVHPSIMTVSLKCTNRYSGYLLCTEYHCLLN